MCTQNINMWDTGTINILIAGKNYDHIAMGLVDKKVTLSMLNEAQGFTAIAQTIDNAVWNICQERQTKECFDKYLHLYPKGLHSADAEEQLKIIIKEVEDKKRKQEIIDALSKDCNAYSLTDMVSVGINKKDLMDKIKDKNGNIVNKVLDGIAVKPPTIRFNSFPDTLPRGTEVYFWGTPSSGKTCVIGAILSCAGAKGMYGQRGESGVKYMNDLKACFTPSDEGMPICLPPGTQPDVSQYLPLTLNETIYKEKKKQKIVIPHNISLVELSGEIFKCFSHEYNGETMDDVDTNVIETYKKLRGFLRDSQNDKYHFFIIDSDSQLNARPEQQTYLHNAISYFKEKGIFDKKHNTLGISLIVSKIDLYSPNKDEWVDAATMAATKKYPELVTELRSIIGPTGLKLTNGDLNVIPFSIGEIFFKQLCMYDSTQAEYLIQLLMEYARASIVKKHWYDGAKSVLKK